MIKLPSWYLPARPAGGLVALAFLCALAVHSQVPPLFTKGPYLQAPGPDTMTLMWESLTNLEGTVHFGEQTSLDRQVPSGPPRRMVGVSRFSITNAAPAGGKTNITRRSITNIFYVYEVTLSGLKSSTLYSYSVELQGVKTPPKAFKTFGPEPDRVTFIAYGDTRTQPQIHAALARQFKAFSPDFLLHTGDLVEHGTNYALWSKEFFQPLARVIDEIPILPVIGNHEENATNFLAYFHLPGQERWYSFQLGPVHILSLDYHYEKASDAQFEFARQDLKGARAPWKIVLLHYPVYNVGGHVTAWGHKSYLPLFHETKVDLVIAGHSHLYERFRPLAPRDGSDSWPITHVTTGGGGAPITQSYPHPALVIHATNNHFMVFEVTRDTLKARTITAGGRTFDTFTLTKPGGQPPPAYLAQVYPEEWLNPTFDVATNLTARLAAVPGTDTLADAMFTIRPPKLSSQPIQFEISVASDSARFYELATGPLRVITPAPGETNKILWTKVRATGAKKITSDRGRELAPGLTFQAKIKADWGETFAYGQRCRVSSSLVPPGRAESPSQGSR